MNLLEFMRRGHICPICKSNSVNMKLDNSKQTYRYENDNIIFTREMRGVKKGATHYKVAYVINKKTNDFLIDFYVNDKKVDGSISISVLNRFKELDKNVGALHFNRECTNCNRYYYRSNSFKLNFKGCTIGDIKIEEEFFGLAKQVGAQFRIFRMSNYYKDNHCKVNCFMSKTMFAPYMCAPYNIGEQLQFTLPVIKFTTENKITNRLNKLLTFA